MACGEDSSPSAPTAVVAAAPSTPTAAPTSPALTGLSLSAASVDGQSRPEGTVTLAAAAPVGGARISLSSSNTAVAKVPVSVTIAPGAAQETFSIDTSTVSEPSPVTISASYAGVTLQTPLMVTGPALVSAFTVRSPSKGIGGCVLGPTIEELDCTLDGRASQGFVDTWIWT